MEGLNVEVGAGPEQWLKKWEDGFSHDHSQQEDPHSRQVSEHKGRSAVADSHGSVLKVDSYLYRNLHSLTGGDATETVLVTLCGNTKDLEWLCSKGYSVVGVELSEKAVKKAFEDACAGPIPYSVLARGDIKIYSATDGKNLRVFVGNFFLDSICCEELGRFNCIWDAHGIISLPVSQQQAYADKLLTLLKPGGKMLFSTVNYDITKLKKEPAPGPVSSAKLAEYFPTCSVELLEEDDFHHKFEGLDRVTNPVVIVQAPFR